MIGRHPSQIIDGLKAVACIISWLMNGEDAAPKGSFYHPSSVFGPKARPLGLLQRSRVELTHSRGPQVERQELHRVIQPGFMRSFDPPGISQ